MSHCPPTQVVGVLLLLLLAERVSASVCTSKCDVDHGGSEPSPPIEATNITFCGSDGQTYHTTINAMDDGHCYSFCGVSLAYAGPCGCPNMCGVVLGHGTCTNGTCQCNSGWGGADCMSPRCQNGCGGHGSCKSGLSGDGADVCVCNPGFTGSYCDVPVFSFTPPTPVIPNSPKVFAHDPTGRNGANSFFNASTLATIRIYMRDEQYRTLIDPVNLYNATYEDGAATMYFDNGVLSRSNVSVGIKVKGYSSRTDIKKAWNVQLFDSDLDGVTAFGLKTGNTGGDALLKTFLATSMGQALGAPVGRTSWCVLYINNILMGVFYTDENIDDASYLLPVFGNNNGDMYKIQYYFQFVYFGPNASAPEYNQLHDQFGTTLRNLNGPNIPELVTMLGTLNASQTNRSFHLEQVVNVDFMLRTIAYEAFLLGSDNFVDGNNYFVYHDVTGSKQWIVIGHDFDGIYQFWDEDAVSHNVYEYGMYLKASESSKYYSVMRAMAFNDPSFNASYGTYCGYLVDRAFDIHGNNVSLPLDVLYQQAAAFISPWYARDILGQLAFGTSASWFDAMALNTSRRLRSRAMEVAAQVPMPPPSTPTPTVAVTASASPSVAAITAIAVCGSIVVCVLIVIAIANLRRRSSPRHFTEAVDDEQQLVSPTSPSYSSEMK